MGDIKKLQGGYYELTKLDSTKGNFKQAYEHYKLYTLYRDSLQKQEVEKRQLQAKMQYEFDKKQAIAKAEQAKKDAEQKRIKNIQYFTIAGLAFLLLAILLFAHIQWRNNKQKKKANALLQQQNKKVEETLTELKSTQSQLIQAEKMASLGELTAGIAHEIQNPLNFVNNFSEVNTELIAELTNELSTGNKEEAISIAKDIKENEEKINHHGKRADAIVKGMLQHSRANRGQKELTDINALADEYLRLSYHGIRAKDKNFNVALQTDFDESIGKINIVPQDIGRVLLNLYNNAFYAVNEKKNNYQPLKGGKEYLPGVTVSTKSVKSPSGGLGVELTVKDNGNGIPQKVLDKIFQPFFTTKPTGEGTGLGLSLSYDIVKAHGGGIKVETKEGEGTEFIINLPINN
ncbi:two-component sensor histidine kinase [Ginsengibacter hankyongi]|uniref:histidine kinase n=2 Tax=Ginsengibacter hankyongi TaxID=2607284 RepID=A0A5J5IRY8_9BACT|nr:two-component sensor histidine kinase [Ginsengibacter hankyongi]